ncbi:flagellin [Shouchella sp. JSM 1781072]|uniref:flagellin N-terminal helical domain-containing protein n=1 Tax=Shouchella sp. JSM 1781072 TaxID=3344581 RepID=UPI0035C22F0A
MIINNNMSAMNAHRQLGANQGMAAKAQEKLSSGLRINRAGDDAAGLAISEKMRAQVRGLDQASRNAQDGISLIQTAEGGLNESQNILQRMRELAVQSANGTNQDTDRDAIQKEITNLTEELDRIADTTKFNDKTLLDGKVGSKVNSDVDVSTTLAAAGVDTVVSNGAKAGTYTITHDTTDNTFTITDDADPTKTQTINNPGTGKQSLNFNQIGVEVKTDSAFTDGTALDDTKVNVAGGGTLDFQVGANQGPDQKISLSISDMSTGANGLNIANISVANQDDAETAITSIQDALDKVSTERSNLGAVQNRLEHSISNLNNSSENLQAAESRIRDVDMAKEIMEFTKQNILAQASQSMLAQANQAPQQVLQLLG